MVLSSISMFGDFIKLHYVVNWIFKKRFCKLGNLRHIWLIDVSVWCCWISLLLLWKNTLHEKCPRTEFFLVRVFLHLDWIQSECGKISTRKNSAFGHFSHSDSVLEEWLTYILSGFRRQDGLAWKRRALDLFNTFHATALGNFSPLLKTIFGGDIKNYFLKY